MSTLRELGKEYRKSCKLLITKIKELNKKKIKLEEIKNKTKNKIKKQEFELEINSLKDRLNKLSNMYRTTREIATEAINYNNKEWWRSEKYTVNARKSRPHICYYGPRKYDYEYELETDTENEKRYV